MPTASASLASGDLLTSSACIGADTLLKLLGNYCRNKDIKTAITVGVVGFPNVGKSSGKIVFYIHPPEQHSLPTHLSADIVSEWSKEFDVGSLQQQEQAELHGLRHTVDDGMVLEAGGPVDAVQVGEEEMESEEGEEESDEDDSESGEEAMEGSDGETQKDDVTVLLKAPKSVTQSRGKADSGLNADEINEFNLQSKDRKKIFKKQQKERRKKAESSAEAMDDSDDDYNFDTDFS